MRFASAFALLFLALCLTATGAAQVVYVDLNAPGPEHDGASWDTAFLTIQGGVDAATPDGEVWVADGTYVENVVMGEGVAIYGGFLGAEPDGYETERDQRDFVNNVVTIDGNQSGSCVIMAIDARVDGFSVTNGSGIVTERGLCGGGFYCAYLMKTGAIVNNVISGNIVGGSDAFGGGVYCYHASPLVANNSIFANMAHGPWAVGGGVCCSYGSSPVLTGNTIFWNSASGGWFVYGGGLYCEFYSAPTVTNNTIAGNHSSRQGGGIGCLRSSPAVSGNVIVENSAAGGGGGIYCDDSSALVTGNTISGNEAASGGGICLEGDCLAEVGDNTISGNTANEGGGIWCDRGSPAISDNVIAYNTGGGIHCEMWSSPAIYGNTISANTHHSGAGIRCLDSSPTICGNVVSGNTSVGTCTRGGGMYFSASTAAVVGNTIADNKAESMGGGLYGDGSSLVVACNVIVRNQVAGDPTLGGGGIFMDDCPGVVANNTIASNWAQSSGGGLAVEHGTETTVANNIITRNSSSFGGGIYCWGTPPLLSHNDFWGNSPTDYHGCEPGEGDISADPLFVDPENGDYHLLPESPCIDAGCNDYVFTDEDIDGDPRIIWAMRFPVPYWPHPGYVDMGADEFVPGGHLSQKESAGVKKSQ